MDTGAFLFFLTAVSYVPKLQTRSILLPVQSDEINSIRREEGLIFFFLFYTPIILDTLFPIRDISIGLFSREKIFGKILCSSHLNFESSEINSPLLNFFKVLSMITCSLS